MRIGLAVEAWSIHHSALLSFICIVSIVVSISISISGA
jgi:hypothetical protein